MDAFFAFLGIFSIRLTEVDEGSDPIVPGPGALVDIFDKADETFKGFFIDGVLHAAGRIFSRIRIDP